MDDDKLVDIFFKNLIVGADPAITCAQLSWRVQALGLPVVSEKCAAKTYECPASEKIPIGHTMNHHY